jgi:hypothetical protein
MMTYVLEKKPKVRFFPEIQNDSRETEVSGEPLLTWEFSGLSRTAE